MYVYCNEVSLHVRVLNNVSTLAQLAQNNKDTQEIQM